MSNPEQRPRLAVARMHAEPTESVVKPRPALRFGDINTIFLFLEPNNGPQSSSMLLAPSTIPPEIPELKGILKKTKKSNKPPVCQIKIQVPDPELNKKNFYSRTASSILTRESIDPLTTDYRIMRDISNICLTHRSGNGLVVDVETVVFTDTVNGERYMGYEITQDDCDLSSVTSPFPIHNIFAPALEVTAAFLKAYGITDPERITLVPFSPGRNHPSSPGFNPKSVS